MFCITFSADFTVWSETADFEGKDCTSYKDCTEVVEILQACCAQCWEVHSEGKPLFCYTLVNMLVAAMADQGSTHLDPFQFVQRPPFRLTHIW